VYQHQYNVAEQTKHLIVADNRLVHLWLSQLALMFLLESCCPEWPTGCVDVLGLGKLMITHQYTSGCKLTTASEAVWH